jgi:hypothetical protein
MMSAKVCVALAIAAAGASGLGAYPPSRPLPSDAMSARAPDEMPNFVVPASAELGDPPFSLDPGDPPFSLDPGDPGVAGDGSAGLGAADPSDPIEAPIEFALPDPRPLSDPPFDFDPGDPGDPAGRDPPPDKRGADPAAARVPEPSTMAMFGLSLIELILVMCARGRLRPLKTPH